MHRFLVVLPYPFPTIAVMVVVLAVIPVEAQKDGNKYSEYLWHYAIK